MSGAARAGRRARGFTLIEAVSALAILAILAFLLLPMAAQLVSGSREETTRASMAAVHHAVLGDPPRGQIGYVGDLGDVPVALADLITKPAAVPTYTTARTNGVGMGWRGPYLDRGGFPGDEFKDGWGAPYEWGGRSGAGGGRTGRGQVRSGGPDGSLGTADDLLFPLDPVDVAGTLLVTVYVNDIPNPQGVTVTVFGAADGAEVSQSVTTGIGFAGFTFTAHQGVHAVRGRHTSGVTTVEKLENVTVWARSQTHLALRLRTAATVTP